MQEDPDSLDPFAIRWDEVSLSVQLRLALPQDILGDFWWQFVRQLPKEFASTQKFIDYRVIDWRPFLELPRQDLDDILWNLSLLFYITGWDHHWWISTKVLFAIFEEASRNVLEGRA